MLSSLTIPLSISPSILWLVFLIVIVLHISLSWIFVHHWGYYGVKNNERIFVKSLFFIISTALLVGMMFSIGFYQYV